ncbi:MAG: SigB/SigF/SigG family RNA polymerase sigma factor [Corallococcus sp.]|nr:SigB/SigF/SigG family RNA polymerase sigma factor [Corallococcus sp.]
MLSHEETMLLISQAQDGDSQAVATLITENTPLIKSVIRCYVGKHVEYDDLFQISSIGLLKAIQNFSSDYNVRFSTYAVPMILGEVKRYMRDDGYVKVSRSLKSLSGKITRFVEEYQNNHAESPTVEVIAEHFEIDKSEVIFAMDSSKMPVSIYEKANDGDDKSLQLGDKLADDSDKKLIDKVILKDMLSKLPSREQKLVIMRYFRDMTQGEIAQKLGVSQVQVSRLENKIIEKLRQEYLSNEE